MKSAPVCAMTDRQHRLLEEHLITEDGLEAAAILLCGRAGKSRVRYVVKDIIPVPHAECGNREPHAISWPGAVLAKAQDTAEEQNLSIFLMHSHPGGLFDFSDMDDASDMRAIGSIRDGWSGVQSSPPHGSAIMVPGGGMRARIYESGEAIDLQWVEAVGDDIKRWYCDRGGSAKTAMVFGDGMRDELKNIRAAVIGVSGTGSIVAEQLARLGIGELTLIDFDLIEHKNLNRILNATTADADTSRSKVEMFADAIAGYRPDAMVIPLAETILSREAVAALSECDVVFSCVDSAEGRQMADFACEAFMLPLIDMGVTIPTRQQDSGAPAVAEALGRIDYVKPGGSRLACRDVYGSQSLRAEYLARTSPDTFEAERKEGYIKGAYQEAPGVISLNMRAASAAVIEYLARLFPFRHDPNDQFARTIFRLAEGEEERFAESEFERQDMGLLGIGWTEPPLNLPYLGAAR